MYCQNTFYILQNNFTTQYQIVYVKVCIAGHDRAAPIEALL